MVECGGGEAMIYVFLAHELSWFQAITNMPVVVLDKLHNRKIEVVL